MDQLDCLKKMTTVVADTGEIELIRTFTPTDATTNPSLILKAAKQPSYRHLIEKAIAETVSIKNEPARMEAIMDALFVHFGLELLKIVPGRVSTEVDAHLSFNTKKSVEKAQTLISMYERAGIARERILIKLASTWEGIRACELLEMHGIHCNMTLLFSLPQAIACAEAKATLISPFVGRILDWYKTNEKRDFLPEEDPGVLSVKAIYNYFKKFQYKTQVMGASFRNVGEIRELAGCDLLTIAPNLLEELHNSREPLERKLSQEEAEKQPLQKIHLDESSFRYELNQNAMATEKLSEGIRKFAEDYLTLQEFIKKDFL